MIFVSRLIYVTCFTLNLVHIILSFSLILSKYAIYMYLGNWKILLFSVSTQMTIFSYFLIVLKVLVCTYDLKKFSPTHIDIYFYFQEQRKYS